MPHPVQKADRCPAPQPSQSVAVNEEICRRLAEWLSSRTIPLDREESSLLSFSPAEIGNFYLLLVAISHQTSPRGKLPLEGHVDGHHVKGWDYLFARLEAAARRDSTILSPDFWARITAADVQSIFRDEQFGDRLTDPAGRALLIRDLGSAMVEL